MDTTGERLSRASMSGSGCRPVGPGDIAAASSGFARKSQCVRKKPSTALSKTTTFTSASFSTLEIIAFKGERSFGPKMFRGGRSNVTRQYDGKRCSRRICPAFALGVVFISAVTAESLRKSIRPTYRLLTAFFSLRVIKPGESVGIALDSATGLFFAD